MSDITPILEVRSFLESGTLSTARTNIGLGSVDNTSDLDKPISTATKAITDAITDRQWVQLSQDAYPFDAVPTSYPTGQLSIMRITTAWGGSTAGDGAVLTDSRNPSGLPYKHRQTVILDNGDCYSRVGANPFQWGSPFFKSIKGVDGVSGVNVTEDLELSGQIELSGQSADTDNSAINRALGDARYSEKSATMVLVQSAADLSGTLDSTKEYMIDSDIDMGSQSIIVPPGGLTITGRGRNVSNLTSTSIGYNMFTDASGDSGGLSLSGVNISCTGATSKIFELDNNEAGGVLFIGDCSFTNPNEIGDLSNFSAALMQNVTVVNAVQGFTFSGTWSSGVRVNLFVGLSGSNGLIYFNEGSSLTFGSRFISNANLNVPTGGAGYNFSPSNFINDGQFSILAGDFSGDGDPVTGITRDNVKSKWRDNNGLSNTYVGGRWHITTEIATPVTVNTYEKLAGTTTYEDEQWFSHTVDNAFVYDSSNDIEVVIAGTMSISSGNNNQIQVKITKWDDSLSAYVDVNVHGPITMSGSGAGENIALLGYAHLSENDRIEVWAQNLTGGTDITMLEGTLVTVSERAN